MPDKDHWTGYLLDRKGRGEILSSEKIKQWQRGQGLLWLHCNYTEPCTENWLISKSGLDKLIIQAMLAEESRPRSIVTQDGILTVLRGINHNSGEAIEDMVSIRIWIDRDCIITTFKRKLLSVEDLQNSIEHERGPKTSVEFLRMITDRLSERVSEALNQLIMLLMS